MLSVVLSAAVTMNVNVMVNTSTSMNMKSYFIEVVWLIRLTMVAATEDKSSDNNSANSKKASNCYKNKQTKRNKLCNAVVTKKEDDDKKTSSRSRSSAAGAIVIAITAIHIVVVFTVTRGSSSITFQTYPFEQHHACCSVYSDNCTYNANTAAADDSHAVIVTVMTTRKTINK